MLLYRRFKTFNLPRQFKEMERQSSRPSEDGEGDFSKLSVIVQRHIDEMEQLEGKWRVEIEEAKACQVCVSILFQH